MKKLILSISLLSAIPVLQASVPAKPATHAQLNPGEAAYRQAMALRDGKGAKRSSADVFRLMHVAAELGHADAQVELALIYERGEGTQKDQELAFEWNWRAAKQGNAYGMRNLGVYYLNGLGTPPGCAEGPGMAGCLGCEG